MKLDLPIQSPILDPLGQMRLADLRFAGEVGDGAGDLEDAGVGAGREAETVGAKFQKFLAGLVEGAEFADVAGGHAGVGDRAKGARRSRWT